MQHGWHFKNPLSISQSGWKETQNTLLVEPVGCLEQGFWRFFADVISQGWIRSVLQANLDVAQKFALL